MEYEPASGLVEKYIKNLNEMDVIDCNIESLEKSTNDEIYNFERNIYDKKIRELTDEKNKMIAELKTKSEKILDNFNSKKTELSIPVNYVERIISFLKLNPKTFLEINENDIRACRDKSIRCIGTFFDDNWLKIKMFIVENGKPKNKYSLCAFGKCLFKENLFILPYSYGVPTNESESYQLRFVVKDFTSIDEAISYFNKIREKFLKEGIAVFQNIKSEFLRYREQYKIEDFEKLFRFRCKSCGFFLTDIEIRGYSIHDRKCPKCDAVSK
jgi:hypothetical protein